MITPGL